MFLDTQADKLSFRVLYWGPPGASKFLSLRRLQEVIPKDRRPDLQVYHVEGGRILSLSWTPTSQERLLGCQAAFELITVPGPLPSEATARLLLLTADAVVFLPDRKQTGSQVSRLQLDRLCRALGELGRSPDSLPLMVQSYRDDPAFRELMETPLPAPWDRVRPMILSGDTQGDVQSVLGRIRSRLFEHCRGLERKLGRQAARKLLARRSREFPGRAAARPRALGARSWKMTLEMLFFWSALGLAALAALLVSLLI